MNTGRNLGKRGWAEAATRLTALVAVLALMLFAGCGPEPLEDSGPDAAPAGSCGDGTCAGGEDCATCSADCGTCPAGCGDCGEDICVAGECVGLYDRIYRFTVVDGTMEAINPATGTAWDPPSGAPDPYVQLRVDGTARDTTSTLQNTYTPNWAEHIDALVTTDSMIDFWMWDDDDDGSDQAAFSCGFDTDVKSILQSGTLDCDVGGSSLLIHIQAQP